MLGVMDLLTRAVGEIYTIHLLMPLVAFETA